MPISRMETEVDPGAGLTSLPKGRETGCVSEVTFRSVANGGIWSWWKLRSQLDKPERRWLRKQIIFGLVGLVVLVGVVVFFVVAGGPYPLQGGDSEPHHASPGGTSMTYRLPSTSAIDAPLDNTDRNG